MTARPADVQQPRVEQGRTVAVGLYQDAVRGQWYWEVEGSRAEVASVPWASNQPTESGDFAYTAGATEGLINGEEKLSSLVLCQYPS